MSRIYLDNQTIAKPSDTLIKGIMPFINQHWAIPSAPHQLGQELLPPMEEAYRSIYKLLGAKDSDLFVFTSSGAEAVNHAVMGSYLDITRQTGKNHYITSRIDEAPVVMAMSRLQHLGCAYKMAEVNVQGKVTAASIIDVMTPRTALVSLSCACGLTGVVHDIGDVAKVCKERGVLFHLDVTHILGKIFFDFQEIGPDIMTFNGGQLHAPRATGGLWVRSGLRISPLILGGQEQSGQRAGEVNVAGLVGLGIAAKELIQHQDHVCTEVARLRDRLEKGICDGFSDAFIFYHDQERLPNCTCIAFPGIANDAMLFALNRKELYACFGGGNFQKISLVLMASHIDERTANTAISFSLSRETKEAEIDRAIELIVSIAKHLRKMSIQLVNR